MPGCALPDGLHGFGHFAEWQKWVMLVLPHLFGDGEHLGGWIRLDEPDGNRIAEYLVHALSDFHCRGDRAALLNASKQTDDISPLDGVNLAFAKYRQRVSSMALLMTL